MGNKSTFSSRSIKSVSQSLFFASAMLLLEPGCRQSDKQRNIVDDVTALAVKDDKELGLVCNSFKEIDSIERIIKRDSTDSLLDSYRRTEYKLKRLDKQLTEYDEGGIPGLLNRNDGCHDIDRGNLGDTALSGQIFMLIPSFPKSNLDLPYSSLKDMQLFRFMTNHEDDSERRLVYLKQWSAREDPYSDGELKALFAALKD